MKMSAIFGSFENLKNILMKFVCLQLLVSPKELSILF